MQKEANSEGIALSEVEAMKFTKVLEENKREMFKILKDSPSVGVYTGQTQKDWDGFYAFYINFLKNEIGPRGQCAKKIRKQLKKGEEHVNNLLSPFGMTVQTHIREIYLRIKSFIPCEEYTQHKKIQQAMERFRENIQKFEDENSPMTKAISSGLVKKHGPQFDVKGQMVILKENYVKRLKESEQSKVKLQEVLKKCQEYHDLIAVEKYFSPFFDEWRTADSDIGKGNIKTGKQFEDCVFETMVPYLIFRQKSEQNWYYKLNKIQVFTNVTWLPKSLGEIDIALGFKDQKQNRYFITTLIECKSRLFDVREAYKQVSLENQGNINKGPTFEELKSNKKNKIKMQIQMQEERRKIKADKKMKGSVKQVGKEQNQKGQEKLDIDEETKIKEKEELSKQSQQITSSQQQNQKKEIIESKQGEPGKHDTPKKFLSTKYGPAELVPNHHFYIITTLPSRAFILPVESKMKQGIDRFTKNMFVQDVKSQPLFQALSDRFKDVQSPLDWFVQNQSRHQPGNSNILVLK